MSPFSPSHDFTALVHNDVTRALAEDIGTGDLTAALIESGRPIQARVLAREAAVICGIPWFNATVQALDPQAQLHWQMNEGERCSVNQVVVEIQAQARALLSAERTALNFLQMLSAVATKTAQYVQKVQGTRAQIVDTRKTLPGLRLAQKYAVHIGGGTNHRIGLFDAILIKENHIAAIGGVAAALEQARALGSQARFIQIEVETLEQLQQALQAGAEMILLDNMSIPTLQRAVSLNQQQARPAVLEISGGVNLDTVRELAQTGVDRISIGTLTKDIQAIDFSMRFEG